MIIAKKNNVMEIWSGRMPLNTFGQTIIHQNQIIMADLLRAGDFPQKDDRIYLIFYKDANGKSILEPKKAQAPSKREAEKLFSAKYYNDVWKVIDEKEHIRAVKIIGELLKIVTKSAPKKDVRSLHILSNPAAIAAVTLYEDLKHWLDGDSFDPVATAKRIGSQWW